MNRLGTCQRVKLTVKQLNQNKQVITSAHSKSLGHPTTVFHAFILGLQCLTQQQAAALSLTRIFTVNNQEMEQRYVSFL